MSLYIQYLKEREGLQVIENQVGFVTFKFRGVDCYIQDIYVLPDCRKSGFAAALADKVALLAKSKGVRILTGSVDSRANGSKDSDKILRAYGMKPYTTEGFMTYYSKEIL